MNPYPKNVLNDVIHIVSTTMKIHPAVVKRNPQFEKLNFDQIDVLDLILEVEKTYKITIPDEVPIYSVDDIVAFLTQHSIRKAS